MNKTRVFEDMNMFVIGLFIGVVIASAFATNYVKGRTNTDRKLVKAYEQYYNKVETLLDSIDENRALDLDDTDLCSDYGVDYLKAKDVVDSITWRAGYGE